MFVKLLIISTVLIHVSFTKQPYIPVSFGEQIRVWCQGAYAPTFGDCTYRDNKNCFLDFNYSSELPAVLSCKDEGFSVNVTVARENFRKVNIKDDGDLVRFHCMERWIGTEIQADREGGTYKKTPRIKWASTTRVHEGQNVQLVGDIQQDEHKYQVFYHMQSVEISVSEYKCNGTRFSYHDYRNGAKYTTPAFNATAGNKEPDGKTNATTDPKEPESWTLSPLYLIIIIVCILAALTIVGVTICICCRRSRETTAAHDKLVTEISEVYPTSLNEPMLAVYATAVGPSMQSLGSFQAPLPDIQLPVLYEEADQHIPPPFKPQPSPTYSHDLKLRTPSPSNYDNNLQPGRPESAYHTLEGTGNPDSCYHVLHQSRQDPLELDNVEGYMELDRPGGRPSDMAENEYQVLHSGVGGQKVSVDDGYRYNVLNREGDGDEDEMQYNVLRRTE